MCGRLETIKSSRASIEIDYFAAWKQIEAQRKSLFKQNFNAVLIAQSNNSSKGVSDLFQ